jgi:hypothetical protein
MDGGCRPIMRKLWHKVTILFVVRCGLSEKVYRLCRAMRNQTVFTYTNARDGLQNFVVSGDPFGLSRLLYHPVYLSIDREADCE